MKKSLLLTLLAFIGITARSQYTLLKANKGLEATYVQMNGKAFLTSQLDSTLWITDGSPVGTIQLSPTIKVGSNGGAPLNGNFVFVGKTDATGWELYISDGTVAGTHLLKDIYGGTQSSNPDDYALFNGQLYFSAENAANGRELWRTNGTESGTTIVKDIVQGTQSSNIAGKFNLFSNGNYLLFDAKTSDKGVELFKSDGTEGGTNLLADINPGADSSNADFFTSYNGVVLFVAKTAANGQELWKTDGTADGTSMVKDIWTGPESSMTSGFFYSLNNKLMFTANNGTNGEELWVTDGTLANTHMVKDINPGTGSSNVLLFSVAKYGNRIIFAVEDSLVTLALYPGVNYSYSTNRELWETDGTEAGTRLFKEIVPGIDGSYPSIFSAFDFSSGSFDTPLFQGNKFFFNAVTPDQGSELWVSDGTAAGTHIVKDIGPNAKNGLTSPSYIITKEAIFFAADDNVHGNEVWKSDGTPEGTVMVADINPNENAKRSSSDMQLPLLVNDKIIFSAKNGTDPNYNLYKLDGSNSTLPLSLVDFIVNAKNDDANLLWTTLSEVNTKDFTVQRSDNGIQFETIGTVNAAGSSTEKQSYNFTDIGIGKSGKEQVYYKLIINDRDGKSTNSKIISLRLKGASDWAIKLIKNPVLSDINLLVTGITEPVKLSVRDISGTPASIKAIISGNGQASLSAANLMPGVYILVAETSKEQKVIKFVKQ